MYKPYFIPSEAHETDSSDKLIVFQKLANYPATTPCKFVYLCI